MYGGELIHAGGKNMIPEDADARTIAFWKAGLKELQQREYIKKSEISNLFYGDIYFEVTRKGYKAADELGLSNPDPSYRADI